MASTVPLPPRLARTRTRRLPFLVVGGGCAGATAAADLVALSPSASVVLVCPAAALQLPRPRPCERRPRRADDYELVALSPAALGPRVAHVADVVVSLDDAAGVAVLGSGREVAFVAACVCVGAVPRRPSAEFAGLCQYVRDAADVAALAATAHAARRVRARRRRRVSRAHPPSRASAADRRGR